VTTPQPWMERLVANYRADWACREMAERANRTLYPDALDYGRHSKGSVTETRYLSIEREYVGRHRDSLFCDRCGQPIRFDQLHFELWSGARIHLPCPRKGV